MQALGVAERLVAVGCKNDAARDADVADRRGARPATDAIVPVKAALVGAPDNLARAGWAAGPGEAQALERGLGSCWPARQPAGCDFERLQALRLKEAIKALACKVGELGAGLTRGEVEVRPARVKKSSVEHSATHSSGKFGPK